MTYLTPAYFAFFEELSNNNSSEWFNANKQRYEKEVKMPFLALVETIVEFLKDVEPELALIEPKQMLFRINRDIRFSKNKSPYKVHLAASLSRFGTKNKLYPSHYMHIGIDEILIGGGAYFFEEKDMLSRVRHYILEHNEDFKKLIENEAFKNNFGEILGEKNKRFTPELQEMVNEQPLIANTQFYWMHQYEPDAAQGTHFAQDVASRLRIAHGLNQFLASAMFG